jgi:hypothetical protein
MLRNQQTLLWCAQESLLFMQKGIVDYGVTVGVRETSEPSDESPKAMTLASRIPMTELT